MVWSLVKGYYVFWIVLYWTAAILVLFNRVAKIEIDSNFNAYVISALAASSFLQAGWSSFAAATVQSFVADTSILISAVLYVVGFISCYVTSGCLFAYRGSLKQSIFPFTVTILFCLWPSSGSCLLMVLRFWLENPERSDLTLLFPFHSLAWAGPRANSHPARKGFGRILRLVWAGRTQLVRFGTSLCRARRPFVQIVPPRPATRPRPPWYEARIEGCECRQVSRVFLVPRLSDATCSPTTIASSRPATATE